MTIYGSDTSFQQVSEILRKLGIVLAASVPTGGALGQVLTKFSGADYDFGWSTILGGIITAGNGIVFSGGNTIHFAQSAAYTAGAVPFATGAATMGFDPANLFWDNTNKRLGIGTAVPGYSLDVEVTWSDVANHIGIRDYVLNSASGNTASYHIAGSFAFETLGANNYTLVVESVMALEGQARHNGTGSCAGLTGVRGFAQKINTGPVTAAYAGRFQVFNQNAVGAITDGIGVFVDTPSTVGSITNYYGLYVAAPNGTTTYGCILAAGTGGTNYGFYQLGATATNFLQGFLTVGTVSLSTNFIARLERNFTDTNSLYGIYSLVQNTPGADTANVLRGAYLACRVAGDKNYTLATDSVLAVQDQVLHNGTGTITGATGVFASVIKQSTGPITNAYGFRTQLQNADATGAITSAYGFYGQTPTVTGTITTYYGLYLAAGAGSTIYGIYQAGNDLNALLGKTGLGVAPSTSAYAVFGAGTTAVASLRIVPGVAPTGPVSGDVWSDGTDLWWADSGGTARKLNP